MNTVLQSQRLSNEATKDLFFNVKINKILMIQLKLEEIVSTRAYVMKKIAVWRFGNFFWLRPTFLLIVSIVKGE